MYIMERKAITVAGEHPEDLLPNKALALPSEKDQRQSVTKDLIASRTPEDSAKYLWALERSMQKDSPAFRRYLRKVYQKHFMPESMVMEATGPKSAQTAILDRILAGWTWQPPYKAHDTMEEGAEECFFFLVWVYQRALDMKGHTYAPKLLKEMDGLFVEHLRHGGWRPDRLDPWIFRKEVPDELALILTKARARFLSGEEARNEAECRSILPVHDTTPGARNLIAQQAQPMLEVDQKLKAWILAMRDLSDIGDIQYDLKSLTDAEATVTIQIKEGQTNTQEEFVLLIVKSRDAFAKKSGLHIRLTIKGPGNFSLEE